MRLLQKNTQASTRMHRRTAITVIVRPVHKNAQTRTRMHRLAAITVSIHLLHERNKATYMYFIAQSQ